MPKIIKEKPKEKKKYSLKQERSRFNPKSPEPYRISRSGIALFAECPRCFYLEKRLGVGRPDMPGFSLNTAVDNLLKNEFDVHRAKGSRHPLMRAYGIDAVPYPHEKLDEWRDSLHHGIQYLHKPTNLLIRGGIDDIWQNPKGEVHIVDYKATSKSGEVSLEGPYQQGYKRQVETYQWLFQKNGFKVSPIAYFVYCNGISDKEAFDGKLEFKVTVIPYKGDTQWIDPTIEKMKACLMAKKIPPTGAECNYCPYVNFRREAEDSG